MDETRRDHRFVPPAEGDGISSRRAIIRGVLAGGLAAALPATAFPLDTLAQGTPAADRASDTGPSRYVLQSGETEIVFVPAAAGGAARLDYRDATVSLSFTGDELDEERNQPLGRLVTARLEVIFDAATRYLTLLAPEVNRDEDLLAVPIRTLAILTEHLTNIGGPAFVKGALQTHQVIELEGVAEFAPA